MDRNQKINSDTFYNIEKAVLNNDEDTLVKELLPHCWRFKGIRKGNKFYTLDSKKEIGDLYYIKWADFDVLLEEEKDYIITEYIELKYEFAKFKEILGGNGGI
jgi:hypothetical protein